MGRGECLRELVDDLAKASAAKGISEEEAELGTPTRIEVTGDHAYAVLPATQTFKMKVDAACAKTHNSPLSLPRMQRTGRSPAGHGPRRGPRLFAEIAEEKSVRPIIAAMLLAEPAPAQAAEPVKLAFVDTGNTGRSVTAEALANARIAKDHLPIADLARRRSGPV